MKKKKIVKASDKFRFNFDWDAKEDTSKDLNPLYNSLHRESSVGCAAVSCLVDNRLR